MLVSDTPLGRLVLSITKRAGDVTVFVAVLKVRIAAEFIEEPDLAINGCLNRGPHSWGDGDEICGETALLFAVHGHGAVCSGLMVVRTQLRGPPWPSAFVLSMLNLLSV